ncbi:MAG: DUF4325 domain-containing protein [Thermodesulfobacteriota bacterium]
MEPRIVRLAAAGGVTTGDVVKKLGLSRATAQRRLSALLDEGLLDRIGEGRAARYVPAASTWRFRRAGLREDDVWKLVEPRIRATLPFSDDEIATIGYAVTEMVNNAIEHSDGKKVVVRLAFEHGEAVVGVEDDGVGCFERIRRTHDVDSVEDAVLQLEKGKLTSMPERHSGEGIFFSSKAPRRFLLESHDRGWLVDNEAHDTALLPLDERVDGTRVTMCFSPGTTPRLDALFARWTDPESLAFAKTRTTVKLAARGRMLLSRSEARRVVAGLERFAHVMLDFAGVDVVGQGFVDEIFRVFAGAHPSVVLEPVRMNDAVAFMVARGRAAVSAPRARPAPGRRSPPGPRPRR